MLDNLESRITFEVPSSTADFDKLIRDNNFTLFWQNLQSGSGGSSSSGESAGRNGVQPSASATGGSGELEGHRDRSEIGGGLMSSLRHFSGERGGPYGWGLPEEVGVDGGGVLVDPSYLWIGAVMVLLVLSGLFCVCSCYLYYKYRRWQKCVSISQSCHLTSPSSSPSAMLGDVEAPPPYDPETTTSTPPSYTVASGLPSYEDAVEHIYRQQQQRHQRQPNLPQAQQPSSVHPPATVKFFESRPQNWLAVTIFEEIHYNFVGRGTNPPGSAGQGQIVAIPPEAEKVEEQDDSERDLLGGTWRPHVEKPPRPGDRR